MGNLFSSNNQQTVPDSDTSQDGVVYLGEQKFYANALNLTEMSDSSEEKFFIPGLTNPRKLIEKSKRPKIKKIVEKIRCVDKSSSRNVIDFTDPDTPHDRVLVVGKEKTKFYIYAGHLSFGSEFFQTLFTGDFMEKYETEIELKELNSADFQSFLNALIPGNVHGITVDNYLSVMTCARRFLSYHVLTMCEKFVIANFASLDKIELLKMAFDYNWNELKDKLSTELIDTGVITGYYGCGCLATQSCNECGMEYTKKKSTNKNKSSYLVENEQKLAELPAEIHSFLFKALLKKGQTVNSLVLLLFCCFALIKHICCVLFSFTDRKK